MRGVDGMRAIAVMAVLFYHAEFGWALGGFLGVEMFLVISGYLITSLLLVEWLRTGSIDFKHFWLRRARRLLPAVALLVAAVGSVSVLFYRETVGRLIGEIVAAAGYFTNWLLIWRDVSYFESFERPSLLQHLWSLSVEEQFYVFWPVLFAVGMGLLRVKNKRTSIRAFLTITIVGIIGSTMLMAVLFTPFEDPSRVYYGTDTRMAGLLVGVSLALVWIPWRLKPLASRSRSVALNATGLVALATLLVLLVRVDEFSPLLYRGGFLVTSVATAGLIGVVVHPSGRLGALLDNKPMNWIGTRSYGIYLWHWPVFMLTRPGFDVADAPVAVFIARVAATFALAEVSYRLVEMPIRKLGFKGWIASTGITLKRPAVRVTLVGAAAAAVIVALTLGPQLADTSASASPPITASRTIQSEPSVSVEVEDSTSTTPKGDASSEPVASPDTASEAAQPPVTTTAGDTESASPSESPSSVEPTLIEGNEPDEPDLASTTSVTTTVAEAVPPAPLTVTIIGDSILAGSMTAVDDALDNPLTIDATVSRQFGHAAEVANSLVADDALGDIVIIHLGTNGAFSDETFDEVMASVASAKRVVVLTTAVPRRWEGRVNEAIHSGAQRWPNVEVLDWETIAKEHDEWFKDDRVHLNRTGQEEYAQLLASVVND